MDQFSQFTCRPENQEMVSPGLISSLGIAPEDIYASVENITAIAAAAGKSAGRDFALLPFCHTVEAKAMGADIRPPQGRSLYPERSRRTSAGGHFSVRGRGTPAKGVFRLERRRLARSLSAQRSDLHFQLYDTSFLPLQILEKNPGNGRGIPGPPSGYALALYSGPLRSRSGIHLLLRPRRQRKYSRPQIWIAADGAVYTDFFETNQRNMRRPVLPPDLPHDGRLPFFGRASPRRRAGRRRHRRLLRQTRRLYEIEKLQTSLNRQTLAKRERRRGGEVLGEMLRV